MSRKVSQTNVSAYFGIPASTDFTMSMYDDSLPLPMQRTCYSNCLVAVCLGGEAEISVLDKQHTFKKNQILCILPGHFVALETISKDFKCCWGVINNQFLTALTSRFPNILFDYLNAFPNDDMTPEAIEEAIKYFDLMRLKMLEKYNSFQKDIIYNILYSFLLDMYNMINRKLPNLPKGKTANERIFDKFNILLSNHIRENRPITFYAEMLNISPKHLSRVVKQEKGINVKRLIDQRMIYEIKQELLSSSDSLKEISINFDFSSSDAMHHFFKKHTEVSPSEYRTNGEDIKGHSLS